jgi:cysteine desulfurase
MEELRKEAEEKHGKCCSYCGIGKGNRLATANLDENNKKIMALRDRTIDEVMKREYLCEAKWAQREETAGNANFSFQFIEGESLLLMLDMKGIAASSGSACNPGR